MNLTDIKLKQDKKNKQIFKFNHLKHMSFSLTFFDKTLSNKDLINKIDFDSLQDVIGSFINKNQIMPMTNTVNIDKEIDDFNNFVKNQIYLKLIKELSDENKKITSIDLTVHFNKNNSYCNYIHLYCSFHNNNYYSIPLNFGVYLDMPANLLEIEN